MGLRTVKLVLQGFGKNAIIAKLGKGLYDSHNVNVTREVSAHSVE